MYESLARFFGLFYISAGFILSTDCSSVRKAPRLPELRLPDSDYDSDEPCHERFPRVQNGYEARPGEFPFMAEVGYPNDEKNGEISWVCGGTLISDVIVLTAAHCIKEAPSYVVRVGSVDIRRAQCDTQEIRGHLYTTHPEYKNSRNDIALLQLGKKVFRSANVEPLNLRGSYDLQNIKVDAETSYVAIGFGLTGPGGDQSDKLLKTANMTVMSGNTCWEAYFKESSVFLTPGPDPYRKVICAVDSDKKRFSDTCQGDSGGPLLMLNGGNTFLLGVTSRGRHCGLGSPGIYTYVLPYLDWIESHPSFKLDNSTDNGNSVARFRNWFENLIGGEPISVPFDIRSTRSVV